MAPSANSNLPFFAAVAPVNAPFHVAEEFGFDQLFRVWLPS